MNKHSPKPSPTIDVYDFDRTVYKGDCTLHFYFFSVRRNPLLLRYLPLQIWHTSLFVLKLEDRTKFKSNFFRFLRSIKDAESSADKFWDSHYKQVKDWYRNADHKDDVIVSASPEFLLRPVFKRLKAKALIATRMNPETGQITGKNCRGEEKVARLREVFPNAQVRKAYADSPADKYIMALAKEKYLVRGDKISKLNS